MFGGKIILWLCQINRICIPEKSSFSVTTCQVENKIVKINKEKKIVLGPTNPLSAAGHGCGCALYQSATLLSKLEKPITNSEKSSVFFFVSNRF